VEDLEAKVAHAAKALAAAETRAHAAVAEAEAASGDSDSLKAALVRVSADLEATTARASATESQARSLKKKAEEGAAAAAAASAEVSKLERELTKAQSQGAFLTTMTLQEEKRFEQDGHTTRAALATDSTRQNVPASETSEEELVMVDTTAAAAEENTSSETAAPETEGSRKLNMQLQTELAESTLKYGDAIEKLREQEQKYVDLASKFELERQLRTGNEAIRNAEYLKHVVLKYMVSTDRAEQAALLPVISEMLQFTKDEGGQVQDQLSRGALRRLGGGIKGFILGPGT
jgi:hypothetical protein